MQLRFLNYFTVLCEELHFGRAASRLAITQPPLSAAIKSLEDDLGVQLLVRNSKLVQLTPAGAAFLTEANQILDRVAQARSVVTAVDHGVQGRLEIGITGSLLYSEVPAILARFRSQVPGIDLVLQEMPSVEQLQALMRGQLHAAFIAGSGVPSKLKGLALREDVFALCVPEQHPLANRASADLRELGDERFVMLSRAAAPARHDDVIASFSQAGIHPQIAHRARSWITVVAMVAQDGGVALVPMSLARTGMAGVRFIPLAGSATPAPAMLVWNPKLLAPALATFVDCAAEVAAHAAATRVPAARTRPPDSSTRRGALHRLRPTGDTP
jgi:DNA-binding transcriptional LysR family regulator